MVSEALVLFFDQLMEGRRLLGMNHDAPRIQTLNQNSYSEGTIMNNRITSLIALITFFGGAIACSDAGEATTDSRTRDSQALSITEGEPNSSGPGATVVTTNGPTLGTAATPGLTIESSSTVTSTPVDGQSPAGEQKPGSTLSPSSTVSGGEIRDVSSSDDGPIRWGSADGGVEVTLGVAPGEACAPLLDACLAAGETKTACDELIVDCEAAVAKPSEPQDQFELVTDCNALGVSCREAGIPAEECEQAVNACNNPDAGTAKPAASIVTDCAELEETCELAGLSETECERVIAACESPASPAQPSIGVATDCEAVLATCLSYGLPQDECEKVEEECAEGDDHAADSREIRLN